MTDDKKYQILIINQINYRIEKWRKQESIVEDEIYAFLSKTIVSANIINVGELSKLASDRMHYVIKGSSKKWETAKWELFLQEIITYADQNPLQRLPDVAKYDHDEANIILLIDDDFEFITQIKAELEDYGYHVIIALDAAKGLDVFHTVNPIFVLLDINLKEGQDLYYVKQLIEVSHKVFTPIVLTSHVNVEENRIAAYSVGANDFLGKPFKFNLFLPYLKNQINHRQRILDSLTIDELTKAYNRKHMGTALDAAIAQFKQNNIMFSLVKIDLDHFKEVNDTYGHVVGDQVLEALSSELRASIAEENVVFRYGGEEFLIYFPRQTADEVTVLIEEVRRKFNARVFSAAGQLFHVTFSAGVLEMDASYETTQEMIESVDRALYESKENGRNRTTIHSRQATPLTYSVLNVFIVDDDRFMRTILSDAFAEWVLGEETIIKIQTFSDGEAFLKSAWYQPDEKHFILLDGIMPNMDGVEVLTEIRGNYPIDNVVVSMLTSLTEEEKIIQALIKGADDYMLKTFKMKEILARSTTLVRRMNV